MIMGSGSPVYNEERASAGVLVSKGDTKILIGMGPGVNVNLHKDSINNRKLDALVYTYFLPARVDEEASLKVIRKNFSGEVVFSSDMSELSCNGKTAVK